jgi:hypothetical protein
MWHAWERGETGTGFLVGKLKGRPLEIPRHRWANVIKMDPREIGRGGGGMEWIYRAQDRDSLRAVVNAAMNLRVLAPRRLLVSLALHMVSLAYELTDSCLRIFPRLCFLCFCFKNDVSMQED